MRRGEGSNGTPIAPDRSYTAQLLCTTMRGLAFATESETPVNPTSLRRRSFASLLKRAKLPEIRFHDLRHTCATLLLGRNVNPKIVSEMLGHSSISIMLDTYSHVLPDMQDGAARALEDALR